MQYSAAINGLGQKVKKKGAFSYHTKEDYREFFTRGMTGDGGKNTVRPWMYLRVFVACFILFSVVTFVTGLTRNHNSFPMVFLLGAILFDLPFITLLYELNPHRDLSVLTVLLIVLIGGVCSISLAELCYMPVSDEMNSWGMAALAGFLEEVVKIIPLTVAILVLKKRDPVTCLIIGAAVGTGFSFIENMGYIFFNSAFYTDEELEYYVAVMNMGQAIFVSIFRGVTVASGHTFWAGFEGWAFGKFRARFGFWGVCACCMTMHFLWDITIPLTDERNGYSEVLIIISLPIMAILTAIAIVVLVVLIKKGRRAHLGSNINAPPKEKCKFCGGDVEAFAKFCTRCGNKIERPFISVQMAIPLTAEEMREQNARAEAEFFAQETARQRARSYEKYTHTANLSAVICALVLSFFLLIMVSFIYSLAAIIVCSLFCGIAFIVGLLLYIGFKIMASGYKDVK